MIQPKFNPTYLYVKTHNVTGLKYFGKTSQPDPHKYKGSGTYWLDHIKIHGYDVTTEVLGCYTDKSEAQAVAASFSIMNDIVNARIDGKKTWANLTEERLDGGNVIGNDSSKRQHAINKRKLTIGMKTEEELIEWSIKNSKGVKQWIENNPALVKERSLKGTQTRIESGNPWHSDETKAKISDNNKSHTQEVRDKISKTTTGRKKPEHSAIMKGRKNPAQSLRLKGVKNPEHSIKMKERLSDPQKVHNIKVYVVITPESEEYTIFGLSRLNKFCKDRHLSRTFLLENLDAGLIIDVGHWDSANRRNTIGYQIKETNNETI
jgi:hypothetical protein